MSWHPKRWNKYTNSYSDPTGKYSYSDITFDDIYNAGMSSTPSGFMLSDLSSEQYLVNAVDINWKGIKIDGQDVQSSGHLAKLISSKSASGNSIPIYEEDKVPSNINSSYISYPSPDEIMNSYPESFGDSLSSRYIDVIFKQLRALQAKVEELEQFKKYGVHSENDGVTTMSVVDSELQYAGEEEPLWATDENYLSPITSGFAISNTNNGLHPKENVELGDSYLYVNNKIAYWSDAEANGEFELYSKDNQFYNKEYLFMTTSNTNIKVELKNIDSKLTDYKTIDLSSFVGSGNTSEKFNILFILNRSAYDEKTKQYVGNNFAWMQIADYVTLVDAAEGYWNETQNVLQNSQVTLGDTTKNRYFINKVYFTDNKIYKFDTYAKYQDFTNTVQPIPSSSSNLGTVAHITIRSVENKEMLEKYVNQYSSNELIYEEKSNKLYIKNRQGVLKVLLGGTTENNNDKPNQNEGMTQQEIYEWLKGAGITVETDDTKYSYMSDVSTGGNIKLAPIADITFINQASGNKYSINIESDGTIKSTKLGRNTLADRIKNASQKNPLFGRYINNNCDPTDTNADAHNDDTGYGSSNCVNIRGFAGTIALAESNEQTDVNDALAAKDAKLNADRIKIGAIYMPEVNQNTYAVTHGYIELENSSDKDFQLDGCYIHMLKQKTNDSKVVTETFEHSLALTGYIPAGGTYLIRGKQYAKPQSGNTLINVADYDQEWFTFENGKTTGELLDFDAWDLNSILLTWGCPGKDVDVNSGFDYNTANLISEKVIDGYAETYSIHYIDSCAIKGLPQKSTGGTSGYMSNSKNNTPYSKLYKDNLYKITFELDPAKQAYQALQVNTKDSSRVRNANITDLQTVGLENEYIEFPKTSKQSNKYSRFPVSKYTPKASFDNKTILTDKTQFDIEKPNMVTVSFGINMATTRCFNWVSGGLYDEYIWIRKQGSDKWDRFESYNALTNRNDNSADSTINKKLFGNFVDASGHIQSIQTVIYDRITNIWPGSKTKYTAHKVILTFPEVSKGTQIYEYKVGRADISGNPDEAHVSDIQTFTLRPKTAKIRIYQTTDQQGFHWIEYQYWAACADKINDIINTDLQNDPSLVPVVLNTGDMTQNGTRINEWLDYYNAGKVLFDHLEQMYCVGNNDLANTDVTALGTGDDEGKSNGYFFHVFYCYEVDNHKVLYNISIIDNPTQTDFDNGKVYIANADSYIPVKSKVSDANSGEITKYYTFSPIKTVDENPDTISEKYVLSGDYFIKNPDSEIQVLPIVSTTDGITTTSKYIPSFYYFGNNVDSTDGKYILMFDSELTAANCKNWFKAYNTKQIYTKVPDSVKTPDPAVIYYIYHEDSKIYEELQQGLAAFIPGIKYYTMYQKAHTTNLYTGWEIGSTDKDFNDHIEYNDSLVTVYTMLYDIITKLKNRQNSAKATNVLFACHEMPFTVITIANTKWSTRNADRSLNGSLLVGSHCNKIDPNDIKSNNWLSRLLEYFGITLVLGGHKHTYMITNPLRELYIYKDGETFKNSLTDGPMTMERTLKNDSASWNMIFESTDKQLWKLNPETYHNLELAGTTKDTTLYEEFNTSKFPIMLLSYDTQRKSPLNIEGALMSDVNAGNSTVLYPYYGIETDNYQGCQVRYVMCQATGYKLKSNKELPTAAQRFSYIIPKTKNSNGKDSPDGHQQFAMYVKCDFNSDKKELQLIRFANITNGTTLLAQNAYSTEPIQLQYMIRQIPSTLDNILKTCSNKGETADFTDNAGVDKGIYGEWVTIRDEISGLPCLTF